MKIKESTSYPHPVLAPWSDDISGSSFDTKIAFRLDETINQVNIHCEVALEHTEIRNLIESGHATFGCFIKCPETGMRRLQPLGFPVGSQQFASGALLGRVQLRPMVWTTAKVSNYSPSGVHAEFASSMDIDAGQILALDDEQIIEVTKPPLPPLESIFKIESSDSIPPGEFEVDTEVDRITVLMPKQTYQLVQELRGTDEITRAALMNSLYAPVIMEVLDQLRGGTGQFDQYRWLHPFIARCEEAGVDITNPSLLNDAQRLLQQPFASLCQMIDDGDEE